MGEAKKRGTFEERKSAAEEKQRESVKVRIASDRQPSAKTKSALLLMSVLAAATLTK